MRRKLIAPMLTGANLLGRARSVNRRFGSRGQAQLGELVGHEPLALFHIALCSSRAPAAPHGEYECEEDHHPADADPPPSLPLIR